MRKADVDVRWTTVLRTVVVCGVMGLALVACGDGDDDDAASEAESAVEGAADATGEALEDAGDAVEDAGDAASDAIEDATNN